MKTKIRILISITFILLFVKIYAQPQMANWYISPKKVNVTAGNGNATVTTMSGAWANATQVANSIYDNNGNLVFYIADQGIFNSSNNQIGTLANISRTTEVTIIPFNCEGGKYHLFYMASDVPDGILIYYSIVDMTTNPATTTNQQLSYYDSGDIGGFAAGNLSISGKRFVYAVYGTGLSGTGKIDRITINPNNTITTTNLITNGFGSTVDYATEEVDLSHDGAKLAWAGMGNTSKNAYTISLDANGNYITSSLVQYSYNGTDDYMGRGIEFNTDGTKLYAGGGNGIYQLTGTGYSTTTPISGTAGYGHSQLEMGINGYIYAQSTVGSYIIGFNPSNNNSLSSAVTMTQRPYENQSNFLTLPDQIDGFYYNTQLYAFNATTHTATTGTWTSGINPWNASVVRIKTSLTVPSGVTLTIRNMTVEFGLGATLNVLNGGTLRLEKATLQAACPLNMWQGIVVTGNGNVTMTNYGLFTYSTIYDAIIGIDLSGTSAKATINNLSYFERNETHIKISNGGTQNSFLSSYFNHQVPLKDQTRGLNQSGGTTGTRYGITGIEVNNTSNTMIIGSTISGQGNTFNDGQYGIYAYNSNVTSLRNTFNTLRNRGILADGQWQNRTINVTNYNTFNGNRTAIDAHYGVNLTVQSNTFNNGYEHGLYWAYNYGSDLKVGDMTTPSLGNTFNYQNWSCIFANDNANAGTQITIARNTIQNSSYAYGILVQESSLATNNTYQEMFISNNSITNIDYGIMLTNIKGYYGQQDPLLQDPLTNTLKIQYNVINGFGVNKSGILGGNSPRIRTTNNEVYTTNNSTWGNVGINFTNGYEGLIAQNTCKSAAGIVSALNMLGANITCNVLEENIVGIDLISEQLRSLGQTHGIIGGQKRQNFFNNMPIGSWDMKLDNSSQNYNKWVDPYTTDSRIDYSTALLPYPPNSIVLTGGTISSCYNTIIGGGGENGLSLPEENIFSSSDFEDGNTQWLVEYMLQSQQYETGANFAESNNSFIPQLLRFENYFSTGNFVAASEIFQQFNPIHTFEKNFKEVYEVALGYRTEEIRKLHDDEIERLIAIASQNPKDAGPAVFSARAILKFKENMDFVDKIDEPPYNAQSESNKTDETNGIANTVGKIKVYPNPAESEVTIETPEKSLYLVSITNAFGQKVFSGSFDSLTKINTSELKSGIYLLEIINEKTHSSYFEKISIR